MLVLVGYLVVVGSVLGGYALAGGHMGALFQPLELLIIGGAAIGSFVVSNNIKVLKAVFRSLPGLLKGSKYTKARYMELMALLYDLLQKARKEGLMAIEADVDAPQDSAIFQRYPTIAAEHEVVEFVTDYLRMMVSGNLNSFELENLMDNEIETHHHEAMVPSHAIQKVADGLPAFGIVAAVMGVVHTMGSVGKPPAELGQMIAHALVGTFLGILLAYGFVAPLSTLLEQKADETTKELQCVKVTLLASMQGYAPTIAVEFGRKVLFSTERPSFVELEAHVKQKKA
ncbi:MAG: flagellar motor stator protein MotA [Burkholderiaceae bacterium]|nr:flagellar motor stator protein MotA [Burkholderiaceae bacterium]